MDNTYITDQIKKHTVKIAHLRMCIEGMQKKIAAEEAELAKMTRALGTIASGQNALAEFKTVFPNGFPSKPPIPRKP